MDWEYIGKLMLSVAVFAPGLIIFAMALVVGLLMLLEKAGLLARIGRAPKATTAAREEKVRSARRSEPGLESRAA